MSGEDSQGNAELSLRRAGLPNRHRERTQPPQPGSAACSQCRSRVDSFPDRYRRRGTKAEWDEEPERIARKAECPRKSRLLMRRSSVE
jgi:hypothetical protein